MATAVFFSIFKVVNNNVHQGFRSSVARKVFSRRDAIVIGPTPPGTGVMNEAFFETLEVNVSPDCPSFRIFGALHAGGADIDDNGSFFHHVGSYQTRLADGHEKNIGRTGELRYVLCILMTYRHRCAPVLGKHHTQRCTGNPACAYHNGMPTLRLYFISPEQLHNAKRRGRHEQRIPRNDAAKVMVGETVYILIGPDHFSDLFHRDLGRQRKLNYKSIYILIVVHVIDVLHEAFLADGVGKPHHRVMKSHRFACFNFIIDISLAGAVVAYQDNGQVWNFLVLCFACRDLYCDLRFYIHGDLLAINQGKCFCIDHEI